MQHLSKIRLSKKYIETIKALALKYFDSDEVRIFGSRTDTKKKGGDIDIYIKTDITQDIFLRKLRFLREFEKLLGEQTVDLIVEYKGSKNRVIFEEAKRTGILL